MLLLLVVGDILGAGIYLLLGDVVAEVGGLAWLAFALAFVLAGAAAASYAELVTRHPGAAGTALYADKAFGREWLTFAVGAAVALSAVSTAATTMRAFAGDYLREFVDLPLVPVTVLLATLLGLVAVRGIELSARVNVVMTLIELGGLLVVIVIGGAAISQGDADLDRLSSTSEGFGVGALVAGAALAFFAFLGFEDAVHVSEEVTDVRRTFPRVLLGAVLLTSVVYLAVTVVAVAVVPPDVLSGSGGPLLEVVRRGPGDVALRPFSAVALVAVANTSLFAMVAASRLLFGMARAGQLPRGLGRLGSTGTPVAATVTVAGVATVLTFTAATSALAETAVVLLLAVLVIVNLAAAVLRRRAEQHGFLAPAWVAPVGAVATAAVLVHELVTASATEWLRLGALIGGIATLGVAARLALATAPPITD